MYCMKCGKDIGAKTLCPYCDTKQHNADPFVTLGDLGPSTNDGILHEVVDEPTVLINHGDCFSGVGDIGPTGDFFVASHAEGDPLKDYSSADPFHALGNLDVSSVSRDDTGLDSSGISGFKPTDELVSPDDSSEVSDEQELTGTIGYPRQRVTFIWKKWMTIAACCATIICLLLWAICLDFVPRISSEQNVQSADDALDSILEAPIHEVNTEGIETPAFLSLIESKNGYEILSFEKTQDGAVATMRVYAPNVYSVAKDLDSNNTYTSEGALINALDNALRTAPLVEKQVVIEYILTEEGYIPVLTVEFLDAYYGGIYQLRNEMIADAAAEAEG